MNNEREELARDVGEHLWARVPAELSEAEPERLRRATLPVLEAARRLRRIRLSNADEPMPFFQPYRGAD
jgi:hypothetical protein